MTEQASNRNFRVTNNNAVDKHVGKRVRLRRTLLGCLGTIRISAGYYLSAGSENEWR